MVSSRPYFVLFLLVFELTGAHVLPSALKREKPASLVALEADSEYGPDAALDDDPEEETDEDDNGNSLLLDRLASLNQGGVLFEPELHQDTTALPSYLNESDYQPEGEDSSEEDERVDESISTNSTVELLPSAEAERTVAFSLITVFSIVCGMMAVAALVMVIVYYKRNITSFAHGKVFAPNGHRRTDSTPEARLLPAESKMMDA